MLKGNIAQMGQFPFAAISVKPPIFQVKGTQYAGNVGDPYGSNIIELSAEAANQYKYVMRPEGPRDGQRWTVAVWNDLAPDGRLGGWRGNACRIFTLNSRQVRYIAFDDNSHGG